MIKKNALGIIFANSHDAMAGPLAAHRSMASLPFGGRYRLIDFSLSALSNAGIDKVGIITKANYYSLMTHLGNGKPWDLDRKNGGLSILPPYASADSSPYKGRLEAIHGILQYLREADEENVVLCDSDVVANIDIKKLISYHHEKGAQVTAVFAFGKKPMGQNDAMSFDIGADGEILKVDFSPADNCNYSLDTFVINRELLIDIVEQEIAAGRVSLSHGIFENGCGKYAIYAYKHEEYSLVIDSIESYFTANLDLLNRNVSKELFGGKNSIYTKTRDDMPAKYGLDAKANNAIIADGCIIDGTVKNSVLFKGVKVEKGAVVENCLLMEGTIVGENSVLKNIITDRFVQINENKTLVEETPCRYIEQKTVI